MKDFKNWREIEDYHQYVNSNNDTHEIFIEYRDIDTLIETARAIQRLVGDWCRNKVSTTVNTTEQEWLGKELPIQELLEITYKDDKENNK